MVARKRLPFTFLICTGYSVSDGRKSDVGRKARQQPIVPHRIPARSDVVNSAARAEPLFCFPAMLFRGAADIMSGYGAVVDR
jgi:hypothetical protein